MTQHPLLRYGLHNRDNRQRAKARPLIRLEQLEPRQLLAALPLGATPLDTGEFMLGTVSVTPVFFDSTGQIDPKTQNWSPETNAQGLDEIDQVMARLNAGLQWWVDTLDSLNSVHTLEFELDLSYVENPFPTKYEPIDRNGEEFVDYVSEFIVARGYSDAASIEEGVRRFNQDQRVLHGTDWALTIFVVDASDDVDDMFAPGEGHRGAFAFAGGLFMVMPSTRSAATFAHEVGHVFWAMDEYVFGASYQDQRGYYDTPALNAADNPNQDQEISIMRGFAALDAAFEQHVSPASTLAHVGWRDSDGDGIFDLADVPLKLDAEGYFDLDTSAYHFRGIASAVPLLNRNSSGPQSDITLNRVSQIQYRLDDGDWIDAAAPDQQVAEFDLTLSIDQPFDTIKWRARDSRTGVTSPIIAGTRLIPALASSSVSGLAFVDTDGGGQRDGIEQVLENTTVVIRHADGSPLFQGQVDPHDQDDGLLPPSLPGITIAVEGDDLHPNAGSFSSVEAGNRRVLYSYDPFLNRWSDQWSSDVVFGATLDQPVGQVTLDVIGIRDGGYGRLEAYDAQGELIARTTTESLATGEVQTITVTDSENRIVSIRAAGHAETVVALGRLTFGVADTIFTDSTGSWSFQNLADGQYIAELAAERVIHQFESPTINFEVSGGFSEMVMAGAQRVDSIRHNASLPEDVNGFDGVTAVDALVVINDLGRNSQRILQPYETAGFDVDVNNDGMVSALDALLVINFLGRENSASEREAVFTQSEPTASVAGPPILATPSATQMLNSAGSRAPVESKESFGADRDEWAKIVTDDDSVHSQLAAESMQPGKFTGTTANDPAISSDPEADLNDLQQLETQIDPDFQEPFGGLTV